MEYITRLTIYGLALGFVGFFLVPLLLVIGQMLLLPENVEHLPRGTHIQPIDSSATGAVFFVLGLFIGHVRTVLKESFR